MGSQIYGFALSAMKKKTVIVITDTDKCSKNMSSNYSKVKE
jgi:hypothetical protein